MSAAPVWLLWASTVSDSLLKLSGLWRQGSHESPHADIAQSVMAEHGSQRGMPRVHNRYPARVAGLKPAYGGVWTRGASGVGKSTKSKKPLFSNLYRELKLFQHKSRTRLTFGRNNYVRIYWYIHSTEFLKVRWIMIIRHPQKFRKICRIRESQFKTRQNMSYSSSFKSGLWLTISP